MGCSKRGKEKTGEERVTHREPEQHTTTASSSKENQTKSQQQTTNKPVNSNTTHWFHKQI